MRKLILLGFVQVLFVLSGCGGGGSSAFGSSGSSGSSGNGGTTTGSNVVTMTVDSGPDPSNVFDVDTPFITVTVCAPGSTTNCETIPNVEVDTGSYGLRLISTAVTSTLLAGLTQESAPNGGASGSPLVECTQFLDGYSWGPIVQADVQVGGESANDVPIQIMGESAYESEIPTACSSTGSEEDTVDTFGANGIIGVGPFAQDCGSGCVITNSQYLADPWYYGCPSGGTSTSDCQATGPALDQQVTNPVADFTSTGDDNGVIIELPSVSDPDGAATATGSLIFGIGTESNNGLGSATVLTADPNYGDITATYNGTTLPYSYFDTGSNAYYFDASTLDPTALPDCPSSGSGGSGSSGSWLCPTTEQSLSVENEGESGTPSDVTVKIYNANTLFTSSSTETNTAFDDIGADTGDQSSFCPNSAADCSFDFGLPFFFGRNVYVAIAGANTSGGEGPYFAY